MHAGMRFITTICLCCLTSLDWFQFGPLGRTVIKNDGHTLKEFNFLNYSNVIYSRCNTVTDSPRGSVA